MCVVVLVSVTLSTLYSALRTALLSAPLSCVTNLRRRKAGKTGELGQLGAGASHPVSTVLYVGAVTGAMKTSVMNSLICRICNSTLMNVFSAVFALYVLVLSRVVPGAVNADC